MKVIEGRVREIGDRFRRADFYAALDAKRECEGVSWRDVARETGVSPSTFSRLARGKDPDMRTFALLAAWLRQDIRPFFIGAHGSRQVSTAAEVRRAARDIQEQAIRIAALVKP